MMDSLTDSQILEASRLFACSEGIFVEPGSAASIAGLLKTTADGRLPKGSTVVCTVTGHGLKDPDTAMLTMETPVVIPVDADAVATALEHS
jgi:threonine synthase